MKLKKQDKSNIGFISTPKPSQIKPTPEEQQLLEGLLIWQKQSAKSKTVLGKPISKYVSQ